MKLAAKIASLYGLHASLNGGTENRRVTSLRSQSSLCKRMTREFVDLFSTRRITQQIKIHLLLECETFLLHFPNIQDLQCNAK